MGRWKRAAAAQRTAESITDQTHAHLLSVSLFWLVGARRERRCSVPYCTSALCSGNLLLSGRTFLSLFAERRALTQVQCSRACVRTSLDHKVTASSGPPAEERTSLFISQSEWCFKTRGGGELISEGTRDIMFLLLKREREFSSGFSFSIEGEYVPAEGDEVTYKVSRIPPKNLKVQAVEVKITHLNPGTKHETWSGQIIGS